MESDFLKKYKFEILLGCSAIAFILGERYDIKFLRLFILVAYVILYALPGNKNNAWERRSVLPKGLTHEDIKNIAFVKNWEEMREKGIRKYALLYGGVFFGFVLCAIFSIVVLLVRNDALRYISDAPSHMINFIGYTYVAGVICGTIIYRFIWTRNEQKFIRLTDPLH